MKIKLSRQIFKKIAIPDFIKIHAGDRHDETKSRFSQFFYRACKRSDRMSLLKFKAAAMEQETAWVNV
jgi:hypothetical protein